MSFGNRTVLRTRSSAGPRLTSSLTRLTTGRSVTTATVALQASPPVGLVAPRAASTSGLSDVEMGEQLDDLMADARCGDCEADATAAPMAEEAAADSGSVADAAPMEDGEEPSNWANLPDGVLQEVITDASFHDNGRI